MVRSNLLYLVRYYSIAKVQFIIQNFEFLISLRFGIDKILDQIIHKIGDVNRVYLTGDLARGLDSTIVDVTIIGKEIDHSYLATLVEKAESLIDRKIRTLVYEPDDEFEIEKPRLLIFGEEVGH